MKHKMYVTYAKNGFVMIKIRQANLNFIIRSENNHYIGKFRGAAHNICKLSYKVTKNIPVVFHNGSTYDYHFTTKQLAEEFKGQFECLRENTEKYITFSVLIKKEVANVREEKDNGKKEDNANDEEDDSKKEEKEDYSKKEEKKDDSKKEEVANGKEDDSKKEDGNSKKEKTITYKLKFIDS